MFVFYCQRNTKQLEEIQTKEIPDLIDINKVYLLYGEWREVGYGS